jgi:hypothetical protein
MRPVIDSSPAPSDASDEEVKTKKSRRAKKSSAIVRKNKKIDFFPRVAFPILFGFSRAAESRVKIELLFSQRKQGARCHLW